jgi:glycosyltransferase involved in cell wall biosynthesis
MVNSIHVARWIEQFPPEEFEFILFPSTPTYSSHPKIIEMQARNGNISVYPFQGRLGLYLWTLDQFFGNQVRAWFLSRLLKKTTPDFVHALEFQHGAYLAERALSQYKMSSTFIATCYGSDIFWFQKFPKHLAKIRRVLSRADFYSAECDRDVALAIKYGFSGTVLPTIPNAGGIPNEYLLSEIAIPTDRNLILIKGYDSWVGRGSIAIQGLAKSGLDLEKFEIVVYSCERRTLKAIKKLPRYIRSKVRVHKKGALSHKAMMEYFAKALVYVGISESDGISTSMVEAMSMGCYPIQTATACTAEWFNGPNEGQEVQEINVESIASAIRAGVKVAQSQNIAAWAARRAKVLERMDNDGIAHVARRFYNHEAV